MKINPTVFIFGATLTFSLCLYYLYRKKKNVPPIEDRPPLIFPKNLEKNKIWEPLSSYFQHPTGPVFIYGIKNTTSNEDLNDKLQKVFECNIATQAITENNEYEWMKTAHESAQFIKNANQENHKCVILDQHLVKCFCNNVVNEMIYSILNNKFVRSWFFMENTDFFKFYMDNLLKNPNCVLIVMKKPDIDDFRMIFKFVSRWLDFCESEYMKFEYLTALFEAKTDSDAVFLSKDRCFLFEYSLELVQVQEDYHEETLHVPLEEVVDNEEKEHEDFFQVQPEKPFEGELF